MSALQDHHNNDYDTNDDDDNEYDEDELVKMFSFLIPFLDKILQV